MAVGTDLAPFTDYLRDRAKDELDVDVPKRNFASGLERKYVSMFGIPEVGVQERIGRALALIPRHAETLVDLGSGAGMLLAEMRSRRPTTKLTGIEIDATSCTIAHKIIPEATIVCGDVVKEASGLRGRFSVATCIDVLEHVPDDALVQFMSAAREMLVEEGTLIIHVPQRNQRRHFRRFKRWAHHDHEREGFAPAELETLLDAAGFRVTRVDQTFGFLGSLAWELNMLAAGGPTHALVFPVTAALCRLDRHVPSRRYNGILAVAQPRPKQ